MSGNQDRDLAKIQILADYYQAQFNYMASIVSSLIVGLLVLDVTFYFAYGYVVFYLFLALVLGALFWYSIIISNGYHSNLENIDQLFWRIQKGETLESINWLRREFQRQHRPLIQRLFGMS